MSTSLNMCCFIGFLGKDPEIRYMTNGDPIANFSIACGESWKDKSGEKQEKTEWIRISAFGKLAQIVGDYLKKGSLVYISGKMQTRKWTNKEGQDQYTTEIVANEMKMLGGKPADDKPKPAQKAEREPGGDGSGFDDMEDDIPFITASPYYDITTSLQRRMYHYGR